MRLGVVIVSHQSADCLERCLQACLRQAAPSEGVIVVDNASTDLSVTVASAVPGVTVVPNSSNPGFAAGVNQGIRALPSADLVLILNPDAILATELTALIRCFDDPSVAIAAGALCDGDGQIQRGFTVRRFPTVASLALENLAINRAWPGNSVNRRWRCFDLDLGHGQDVEQPAGAFLLLRRQAWLAVGGFDEGFRPVWFEDVDFCLRIRQAGYRIRYDPVALAVHEGGHSVRKVDWGKRQLYWNKNQLRYARLHFPRSGQFAVALSVALGVTLRGIWETMRQGSPGPLHLAGQILHSTGKALSAAVWPARHEESKNIRERNSERG